MTELNGEWTATTPYLPSKIDLEKILPYPQKEMEKKCSISVNIGNCSTAVNFLNISDDEIGICIYWWVPEDGICTGWDNIQEEITESLAKLARYRATLA